MSSDEIVTASAPTQAEALAEVKKKAAEKFGQDAKYNITIPSSPSKNLTTGETILYTASAKIVSEDQ